MRKLVLITLALGLLSACPALALTGEELLKGLRAAESPEASKFEVGLSLGFVSGISHLAKSLGLLCGQAENITIWQLAAIARKHIENNPSEWHKDAESLVLQALVQAFPCTKR
jgi:hypothetical protein